MQSVYLRIALTFAGALGLTGSANAQQESAARAAALAKAKVSMEQERDISHDAAPGKIIEEEFEREHGAWRYSFDIREGERIHEIGVDAQTGEIVEDSWEGRSDED